MTSLLRISGLAQERRFVNDHRVLNRAAWSPRRVTPVARPLASSEAPAVSTAGGTGGCVDWARQLVLQARRLLPGRDLVLVGDNGFAAMELLDALGRQGITCITRLRLDAALYEFAPQRRSGTNSWPRIEGTRLPNISDILVRPDTGWQRVMVPGWHGEGERIVVELCSATAVWRHAGI